MRCFVHQEAEAVGTCRACNKGLCPSCAVDLGHSITCKGACEIKANAINSQLANNAVLLQTQRRNKLYAPLFFVVIGVLFAIFAQDGKSLLNLGTVMGGSFVIFGVVLAVLSHRYVKAIDGKA
jgi:hypothetical protein